MDQSKIMRGVQLILEGIGEDADREGLKETPRRVAEMCGEILEGIEIRPELQPGFSEEISNDVIILKDIPFYSVCEHHLLPFFGRVHLAYIPEHNRVSGFSAITRVIDIFSRRLQIQERLTQQIADTVMASLQPAGVAVVVEAQQLCVSMRGGRKDSVRTVTQAVRGEIPSRIMQLLNGIA
ncbi:MAG: GTP cyclohydrolase I FolE [Calditrichaeota bacterium]|nr:GTP cyclohydrolase I FolE [Calditrichota bacterium]RQW05314.1 MAG: GTP cyclohydrolase I FolE [Calditrichota bacterium]